MEKIIITHPDGSKTPLVSRKNTSGITKAEQVVSLLADDVVNISVNSATPLQFVLGDTIEVYGKTYTLNQLPTVKKTGERRFDYELIFEGVQYELIDAQFLLPDETVGDSFTGNLFAFLQILVSNANRVFPGKWTAGEYPDNTEYKTLTFSEENCLSALQRICEEYQQEFEIIQTNGTRILHIRKAGVNFPYTFKYGRTGGLYQLTRQNINSKNVVTRLFAYGGSANVPNSYLTGRSSSKLCLPSKNKNTSYIQDAEAIAAFGVKENTKTFDDIFPNRYGSVTAKGSKYYAFVDSTMNFDLNEKDGQGNTRWLIAGVSAKVHFNTGNLAGYEFDVHSYNHATKTIEVVPFQDENGMKFPSETSAAFQFATGDKYFFIDINLPDAYITEAEQKLYGEAQAYYTQNRQPQVQYGLNIDENFIKQFAGNLTVVNLFAVGDYIPIEDADIGVNKSVRITGFTRDLLKPYNYAITLGDAVTKSAYVRQIADQRETDRIIEINNLANPAKSRRNWRAAQEVLSMVFDPDGDYYSEKIKPLSIETGMLQVGAKSMQFVLQNVIFEPNYQGNQNYINISGGTLVHYTIEENIRSWTIATVSYSNLVGGTAYYIYARCQKSSSAGNIILDTVQRKVEHEAGYYTFMVGVLNSVQTDTGGLRPARLVSLTYGSSTVNGRFIKTGRIESSGGGGAYFDLDNGEIGGKISFKSGSSGYANITDKPDLTPYDEALNYVDNVLPNTLERLQAQIDDAIESWFYHYDPTLSNVPASDWTTAALKDAHLDDTFTNLDSGQSWRFTKDVNSVYKWTLMADSAATKALVLAGQAQDTADGKRRTFVNTPFTPYDVGDLWVQGASGDIMRCKTARQSGNYNASDWEKASKYTDDAALNDFVNVAYSNKINDLESQIDGKIETWFQTSDPSTSWTTAEIKAKHVGDMWFNSSNNSLWRYSTSYTWAQVKDQKSIDAYSAASNAQDTADGKRRVFISTPTTPYDAGDLWTDGTNLWLCVTARASGSYTAADWGKATGYDNTKTVMDGGVVTSGTVLLAGSDSNIKAGITGAGTENSSVRIWAGDTEENKATAPFRVTQDGKLVATNAEITGKFKSSTSKYRRLEIDSETGSISMFDTALGPVGIVEYKAYEIRFDSNTGYVEFKIQYLHPEMGLRSAIFSPYKIKVDSLPSSSSGLEQGQIWRDGNTLKIA
jgi:hypothetical protein